MTHSLRALLLALCIPLTALATHETLACKAYRQSLDLLRDLDVPPKGTVNVVSGRTGKVRSGDYWTQVWTLQQDKVVETVSTVHLVVGCLMLMFRIDVPLTHLARNHINPLQNIPPSPPPRSHAALRIPRDRRPLRPHTSRSGPASDAAPWLARGGTLDGVAATRDGGRGRSVWRCMGREGLSSARTSPCCLLSKGIPGPDFDVVVAAGWDGTGPPTRIAFVPGTPPPLPHSLTYVILMKRHRK